MKTDDDTYPYLDFDWLEDGSSRFFQWCASHWRASVAILAGTPVLVGVAVGFILGKWVF